VIRSIVVENISNVLDWIDAWSRKLDINNAELALKTCIALVIGYGAAFLLNISATTTVITIIVLNVRYLGASLDKSILRIFGTLASAVLTLFFIGMLAQERVLFIAVMAVFSIVFIYIMQGSRYPYAWFVCAFTTVMLSFIAVDDPDNTFHSVVSRVSGVLLGIVSVLVVHGLLWPNRAGDDFEKQLKNILDNCRKLLTLKYSDYVKDDADNPDSGSIEKNVIVSLPKLRSTLNSASFDTGQFSRYLKSYNVLIDNIVTLVSIIVAFGETIRNSLGSQALKEIMNRSEEFNETFTLLENQIHKIVQLCNESRDGSVLIGESAFQQRMDSNLNSVIDEVKSQDLDIFDASRITAMISKLRKLTSQVIKTQSVLLTVEDPKNFEFFNAPEPDIFEKDKKFSISSPRVSKALFSGLVIILASTVWIFTNWPLGTSKFVFFAWIIAYINVVSLYVPPRSLLVGLVWGAAAGSVMYFLIMPVLDGFLQLAPFIIVFLFPFCYMMFSSNPITYIRGMMASLFVIMFIDVSESQTYSFSSYINIFIGSGGGFLMGLLTLSLFEHRVPEKEFRTKLASFFGTCEKIINHLEEYKPWTPEGSSILKTGKKELFDHIKTCRMWSGVLNYDRVLANDKGKVSNLMAAIEALFFRIDSLEQARKEFQDESSIDSLRGKGKELEQKVLEVFKSFQDSLSNSESVPELPDISELIKEIRIELENLRGQARGDESVKKLAGKVLMIIGFYHAFTESIIECRNSINALDWKAWDQAYF